MFQVGDSDDDGARPAAGDAVGCSDTYRVLVEWVRPHGIRRIAPDGGLGGSGAGGSALAAAVVGAESYVGYASVAQRKARPLAAEVVGFGIRFEPGIGASRIAVAIN